MPRKNPYARPHRGSRPHFSVTNTTKVYCEKCDAAYNVLKSKNVDQWLNLHWSRNNCVYKKLLRMQEEDTFEPKPAVRHQDSLKSDKAFVIEGVRQNAFADDKVYNSDDESVDSEIDFDIHLPVQSDSIDDELYDDYNEGFDGFFCTPVTSEDVGQTYHHTIRTPGTFSTIQLEEIDRSESREIPIVDAVSPTPLIFNIQQSVIRTLGVDNQREDFIIRSRFRNLGASGKKQLADIVDLYSWGLK